jgi:hypothetical protein
MDKKIQLDVVPPFSLVAAYRRGEWSSANGELVCGGCNKKDNLPNQQVVLSCRGERITHFARDPPCECPKANKPLHYVQVINFPSAYKSKLLTQSSN